DASTVNNDEGEGSGTGSLGAAAVDGGSDGAWEGVSSVGGGGVASLADPLNVSGCGVSDCGSGPDDPATCTDVAELPQASLAVPAACNAAAVSGPACVPIGGAGCPAVACGLAAPSD